MGNIRNYSQYTAFKSLVIASLRSIARSPSAIIFGLAFPLIFILVFGFLGSGNGFSLVVADPINADTSNLLAQSLRHNPALKWKHYADSSSLQLGFRETDYSAIVTIVDQKNKIPQYLIDVHAPSAEMKKAFQVKSIIESTIQTMDTNISNEMNRVAKINFRSSEVRENKMIDFVLPGQLGFSLLAGAVFGTAFIFFNLRQTLVLKRYFATPVSRSSIILGEGIARMTFQLITAIIIIGIGHWAFGFTLIHGWITFIQLLLLSILGILVFMGFGFIVSGFAKNDSSIPPFANLITLPQFLLAGTFFSINAFPKWLQPICKTLPLTYLNDAFRKISFEGMGFWAVRYDILALLIWGIILYIIASKVFKWE